MSGLEWSLKKYEPNLDFFSNPDCVVIFQDNQSKLDSFEDGLEAYKWYKNKLTTNMQQL